MVPTYENRRVSKGRKGANNLVKGWRGTERLEVKGRVDAKAVSGPDGVRSDRVVGGFKYRRTPVGSDLRHVPDRTDPEPTLW